MGKRRKCVVEDDREDYAARRALPVLIAARDSFLSGWGGAEGGYSIAAWACRPEDGDAVFRWVKRRSDMQRVKRVDEREQFGGFVIWKSLYPGAAHVHIYEAAPGHPALQKIKE